MGWDYRGNQCPKRGYGLSHVQNGPATCVFCGIPITQEPPPGVPDTATQATVPDYQPFVSVAERLQDLGLMPPPLRDSEAHEEQTPVEPKMITGQGPQGKPHGRGRGQFSDRDAHRAWSYVGWRAFLASKGEAEE
jgi:hypothetical protein